MTQKILTGFICAFGCMVLAPAILSTPVSELSPAKGTLSKFLAQSTQAVAADGAAAAAAADEVPVVIPDDMEKGPDGKLRKKEKVITGIIASQGNYGRFGGVESRSSGSAPGEEEGGVISGSVVWAPGDVCKATLTNNGLKSYSVYFVVNGISATDGKKVFSKSGSGTVKPKSSMVREIFGCKQGVNLALDLRSAKALK